MIEHNVALVDDHHMMRTGLTSLVNGMGGYHVTQEAAHGQDLIDQLDRIGRTGPFMPAIAIVDLNMPVMDGFATIAWLRRHVPAVLPIALTFDGSDDMMTRALHAGARGFLPKTARPAVLRAALDSLILTGWYLTEGPPGDERRTPPDPGHERTADAITPREMEFLQLVCHEAEYTYEQIADRMGVHRRTVDNFRIGLFEKFNIKSKTGLVLFAMRWGLLPKK